MPPSAAPELTPSISGLAMGLPVMRCIKVPARASRIPAPKAAATRGARHGSRASNAAPLLKYQPSGPRPQVSARNREMASAASNIQLMRLSGAT